MVTMFNNPTFFPTPTPLIVKMVGKIKGSPYRVLEPSAGKGDIIEYMQNGYGNRRGYDFWAIEKDENLQATLRGKSVKLLDSDFLMFSGPDKFDLIIANPPFNDGEKHLLKAIDIMYSGQIIFLLNAETIQNPHTNTRKELVRKLGELDAEIEYIKDGFRGADVERKTDVEVALISIVIEKQVEEDLFAGCTEGTENPEVEINQNHEVITGKRIEELVAEYNQVVRISTKTIINFFENHRKVGEYLSISIDSQKHSYFNSDTLTEVVKGKVNEVVMIIRKDFWERTLELPAVKKRLTKGKADEFYQQVKTQCYMDFTEHNIRTFVLNLIRGFKNTLREAIVALFDKLTIEHCYRDTPMEKNIHYFNGWKTNKAFKVNNRVIIPVYGGYGNGPFVEDFSGRWKLSWDVMAELNDIDIVMNYFDGMGSYYHGIIQALTEAFESQENITSSTYFSKIIAYKKGTLHLTFRDEDILRRFNLEACKGKGWLPEDYGKTHYKELDIEHKNVVDSFEGRESYTENLGRVGLVCPSEVLALTEDSERG